MKPKLVLLFVLLGAAGLLSSCSTGYRSEIVFNHISGIKYNLAVKVVRVNKSIFGVKENILMDAPSNVWELGKQESTQIGHGDETVSVNAFVPSNGKADAVYNLEVKQAGDTKLSTKFIIKQKVD